MAWLTGYPRAKIDWSPTIDREKCVKCAICMNCGRNVFAWTKEGAEVVRPNDCVVGCSTCANLCLGEAITFPDLQKVREIYKKNGLWAKVKKQLKAEGKLTLSKISMVGIVLALSLFSVAGSVGMAANTCADQSKTSVRATKGVVLVTNSLDVDFSAFKVTFIEIGADRCIPCKKMQPIMKEIAAEFAEDVQVVFYDVWKDPEPGRKYGIQLIPTQVFVDADGKEVYRHVGLFPKEEILALLKKHGVH